MKRGTKICVYAGSAVDADMKYLHEAYELGRLCANRGIEVACGGGNTGMMKYLIDGCVDQGGHVTGVLPQFMIDNAWHSDRMTQLIVTADMHSRKQTMMHDADWAVALPGGVGTFEELMEIITWRQLGLFHGGIIIVNIDGYYDPMIQMFQKAVAEKFMKSADCHLWMIASDATETIGIIESQELSEDGGNI